MNEKTISTNQASLMLVIFTIALKLSVLPALMCEFAGISSYVSCFIALVIDFLCTTLVVVIISKIPNMSFFELLKTAFGRVIAIITHVMLFVYFFIKLTIGLTEIHDYYTSSLFEELNPYFALITLFFLLLYMFIKNFRTLGRLLEVFFWPMAIGIIFTLIFPFSDVELSNLLPLFEDGANPIFIGVYRTSLAFGDFMLLFSLMGKISFNKNSNKKILLYALNAMLFIFNFYVVFVGAFGRTTINQTLALGELPLHSPQPSTINRLEWLTVIIWTAIMFINIGILGKCCSDSFKRIFRLSDNILPAIVISVLEVGIQVFAMFRVNIIARLGTTKIVSIVTSVFYSVILLLLVVGYLKITHQKSKYSPPQKVDKIEKIPSINRQSKTRRKRVC